MADACSSGGSCDSVLLQSFLFSHCATTRLLDCYLRRIGLQSANIYIGLIQSANIYIGLMPKHSFTQWNLFNILSVGLLWVLRDLLF